MHDAKLYLGLWESRSNRIRKALKTIDTGNQNISYATILKLGENVEPELGAFIFGDPVIFCGPRD